MHKPMNSSHNRHGLSAGSGSGNPAPKMPKDKKEKEVPKTTPEHNPKHLATKSEESTLKSKSSADHCFGRRNEVNPERRTIDVASPAAVALEKHKKKTEVATRKQGPSDEERTSKSKSSADIALSRSGNVYTYNSPGAGQQPSAADHCLGSRNEVNLERQTINVASPATVAVEKPKKKTEDATKKQGPSDSKQQQQSDPKKEKKGDREDATKKQGPSDSKQQQQSDPKKGKKGDREDATKKQGPSDSKQQQQSDPKKEKKGDRKPQSE